jgi:hypothetical protein
MLTVISKDQTERKNWIERQSNVDVLSMGQKIADINFECWRILVVFAWYAESN